MSTDRQRQWVIADLVSEAVMDGWLRLDYVDAGTVTLKLTEAGHRKLDEYFENARWQVSMTQPDDGGAP